MRRLASGVVFDVDGTLIDNTYLHTGLPPAPISNPGLASIRAALLPATGFDYLYFLTDSTGHAHFSKTLAQHNQCQVNLAACPTAP